MKHLAWIAALALLGGGQTMQDMWAGGGFQQRGDKVRVTSNLTGLRPNGEFGFHIHEAGDCSSGDGMSAKGASTRTSSASTPARRASSAAA